MSATEHFMKLSFPQATTDLVLSVTETATEHSFTYKSHSYKLQQA
jgi:hypothetical protein